MSSSGSGGSSSGTSSDGAGGENSGETNRILLHLICGHPRGTNASGQINSVYSYDGKVTRYSETIQLY